MLTPVQVRRRRILGVAAAFLGVLLVVLAVLGMTGRLGAGSDTKTASPNLAGGSSSKSAGGSSSASPEPSSSAPAENTELKLPLTVLNGGGISGLAGRARDAFVAKGWEVSETSNYTGTKLDASVIYYPANNPDAQQAGKNLQSQFPKLTELKEAPANLSFGGVVVVLAGDWDPKDD